MMTYIYVYIDKGYSKTKMTQQGLGLHNCNKYT